MKPSPKAPAASEESKGNNPFSNEETDANANDTDVSDLPGTPLSDADRMMDIALVGMGLFGLLMIVMAFWATPKGRRFTQQSKVPTLEAREGMESQSRSLHWLVMTS